MTKKIVVFAGNGCRKDKENYYFSLAYKTGKLLAQAGFVVITGGGPGLMNEVSKGADEAGGKTIGICLKRQGQKRSKYLSEKHIYTQLRPRQEKLLSLGDGFIALPGGIGTLYEIVEIMGLKRKGEITLNKPLILVSSYFHPLINELKRMYMEGFVEKELESFYFQASTAEEAVKVLKSQMGLPCQV